MPRRIRLPSGLEARAKPTRQRAVDDVFEGEPTLFGRTLNALPTSAEIRDGDRWRSLDTESVRALSLRDFHRLRDLLLRTGAVEPEPDDAECTNCGEPFAVDPRTLDVGDLEDAASPDPAPGPEFPLPAPIRARGSELAETVTVVPVTVGEALPLWRHLAEGDALDVTPRILAAMGVRALGPLTSPAMIARRLRRADDATWAAVERAFASVSYAEVRPAPVTCPRCGASHDEVTPMPRELYGDVGRGHGDEEPFPYSAAELEALVERVAPSVFEARNVEPDDVVVRIEPGVPATDVGGTPLLGSYLPGDASLGEPAYLVTLYFRSFAKEWEEAGAYDVEAEVRETLDHELEHHVFHLRGHDPMHEAEQAEARQELASRYGPRRTRTQERVELARNVGILVLLAAVGLAVHFAVRALGGP